MGEHPDEEARVEFSEAFHNLMAVAGAHLGCVHQCQSGTDCQCNRALQAARARASTAQDILFRSVSPVKN